MATKAWQGQTGNWYTASYWSSAGVPGPGDDVSIFSGRPQITSDVGTVQSVSGGVNSTEILEIRDGALAVTGSFNLAALLVDTSDGDGGSSLTAASLTLGANRSVIAGNGNLSAATTLT